MLPKAMVILRHDNDVAQPVVEANAGGEVKVGVAIKAAGGTTEAEPKK